MLLTCLILAASLLTSPPPTMNKLSPEETRIIEHKGTEAPFSGKYNLHTAAGTYSCKRCGSALYRSQDKFDSGCGWPAFDDEIEGTVHRSPDADGRRIEITCKNCGGHLGHVFEGEALTDKNTRHCVNSLSLHFTPATEEAIFAGGCFWGVEHLMQQVPGVISVESGYIGGHVENPSYKEVCTQTTGHLEAVKVTFEPSKTDYEKVAKLFFEIHDPTQTDGQGPDIGLQYHSAVFYANEKQKQSAQKLMDILSKKGYKLATKLLPTSTFYPAEDYHQDYYAHKGTEPYCHSRVKRFD